MEIHGSHVIQKRDLLGMLDGLPESEYVAVELQGLPDEEGLNCDLPVMPEAPIDLDVLRTDSERAGRPNSADMYIEALEERVKDLEDAWPTREKLLDARAEAFAQVRDVLAISDVRRSRGRTHLVCDI